MFLAELFKSTEASVFCVANIFKGVETMAPEGLADLVKEEF